MKTASILIGAMLLLITSQCLPQTTMEEYNYITKGYKVQLESGLDMKQGYKFEDVTESTLVTGDSSYKKTEFKALFRRDESAPCAILCVFSNVLKNDLQNTDYICIPHLDSPKEIWTMTYKKIAEYSGESAHALTLGLMHLASHYTKQ
jgi:hypothetical protein